MTCTLAVDNWLREVKLISEDLQYESLEVLSNNPIVTVFTKKTVSFEQDHLEQPGSLWVHAEDADSQDHCKRQTCRLWILLAGQNRQRSLLKEKELQIRVNKLFLKTQKQHFLFLYFAHKADAKQDIKKFYTLHVWFKGWTFGALWSQ